MLSIDQTFTAGHRKTRKTRKNGKDEKIYKSVGKG